MTKLLLMLATLLLFFAPGGALADEPDLTKKVEQHERAIKQLSDRVKLLEQRLEGLKRASKVHGERARDIVKWGESVDKKLGNRTK